MSKSIPALLFAVVGFAVVAFAPVRAAEPVTEALGNVETLASPYPDHWLVALDSSFFHMLEGKGVIVDPLGKTVGEQFKGMITTSFMAAYAFSARRNEHYVAESFFSRGGRGGERTDFVTIWDPQTLEVAAEIEIPAKRLSGMPKRIATALIDNDRFLLVYNFTPAQSVSVVNLESRQFAGEVPLAGCAFVIPTGQSGFSSLCADGAMLATTLDRDGEVAATYRTEPIFDINDDPAFEALAIVDGTGYFPTFRGNLVPVKLNSDEPLAQTPWSLVTNDERAAGWRPGGPLPIIEDEAGFIYVLMQPEGKEGTHKDGGAEVWVFSVATKRRIRRIELVNWGLSLGMTGGKDRPLLAVTNAELGIDIYDATTGEHVNQLLVALDTPFRVEPVH